MTNIIKLGSLVMNGEARPFPTQYDGENFWLGDTNQEYNIPWLVMDKKLVCCWNLFSDISLRDLDAGNWVTGKIVFIDGFPFTCRLLRADGDTYDEWRRAMRLCGQDNAVFHWRHCLSWVQVKYRNGGCLNCARGGKDPDLWFQVGADDTSGWRPVLAPLDMEGPYEEFIPGWKLLIWKDDMVLKGVLQEQTPYDMLLRIMPGQELRGDPMYRQLDEHLVAIDPGQVKFVQIGKLAKEAR